MIDLKLIDRLLDKLQLQTQASELNWLSLPQYFEVNNNEPLRRYIIDNNKYAYSGNGIWNKSNTLPLISEYRSRCIAMHGGVITIFVYKNYNKGKSCDLALQTTNVSPVTIINCTNEQDEKISKLLSTINDSQYSITQFVKSIVEEM